MVGTNNQIRVGYQGQQQLSFHEHVRNSAHTKFGIVEPTQAYQQQNQQGQILVDLENNLVPFQVCYIMPVATDGCEMFPFRVDWNNQKCLQFTHSKIRKTCLIFLLDVECTADEPQLRQRPAVHAATGFLSRHFCQGRVSVTLSPEAQQPAGCFFGRLPRGVSLASNDRLVIDFAGVQSDKSVGGSV